MKTKFYVAAMIAGLMLGGCSQDKKQAEAPVPATKPAVEQTMDKVVEAAGEVKEEAAEVAAAAKEKVAEASGTVKETVVDATVAVKKEATEVATAAKEKGQMAAGAVKETVVEKSAAVTEKVEEKMEQLAPVAVVKETADKLTTTVETVELDNKNGKVVLAHKKHAEAHGCAACHGDQTPGPFKLGKDAGHALCQGCHKEKKAGPTTCTKCHQKKAKAMEGC